MLFIVCHTGPESTQSLKHCLKMNYLQLNRSSIMYRQIAVKIAVGTIFLFKKICFEKSLEQLHGGISLQAA